jgi:kumamolisin
VAAGGGMVSMSFGGSEFNGESSYDSIFTGSGVVYFASAGDAPGVEYPCASVNVVCVGGTTISHNQQSGAFESEATWNWGGYGGTGGGPSAFEPRPSYQNAIGSLISSFTSKSNGRGVPDLAAIANPDTGVWIYSTAGCSGWCIYGGTSVASPVLAGIFNFANFFYSSSNAAVSNIYQLGASGQLAPYVTDINNGVCGPAGNSTYGSAEGFDPANIKATTGIAWSFCAGWGTPKDSGNPNWMRPTTLVRER